MVAPPPLTSEPTSPAASTVLYDFGPFRLDPAAYVLTCAGEPVPLRPKVFELLVALVSKAGEILDKDYLMRALWPKLVVEDNNLTVLMTSLRRTLGDNRGELRYIVTLPGRGYRFAAPVNPSARARSLPSKPRKLDNLTDEVLAILPFKCLGSDVSDYLELGLPDVLASRLSRLPNIIVRPTRSTARYHHQTTELSVIGRELNADVLLTGSIQKTDNRFRVSVQLVRTELGSMIWSEVFDEPAADLFELEDRVAGRVAAALTRRLTAAETARLHSRSTQNQAAHQAYIRARSLWARRNHGSLLLAIDGLGQAVALDPQYVEAYAALADCYNVLALYSTAMPIECSSTAKKHATRALALDPHSAAAHTSLAFAEYLAYQWDEALAAFQTALALDPTYPIAHHWYSNYLIAQGDTETGIKHARKALELDPASVNTNENLGNVLFFSRYLDEAAAQLLKTLELDPHFAHGHCILGLVYLGLGLSEDGLLACERAVGLSQDNPYLKAALAHCWMAVGQRDRAQALLDDIIKAESGNFAAADSIAFIHVALGNTDEAFAWLTRALAERSCRLQDLRVNPLLDPLRRDPRFERLLQRAGLSRA